MAGPDGGDGSAGTPGVEEALAEIVDLVGRLDPDRLLDRLGPRAADQLLTGMTLVAEAVTRSGADALGGRLGVEVDAPESRTAVRARHAGVRIVLHDDDLDDHLDDHLADHPADHLADDETGT